MSDDAIHAEPSRAARLSRQGEILSAVRRRDGVSMLMPENAKRKVCTRCGFVLFPGPKLVAGCLVIEAGRVLLIRRGIEPAARQMDVSRRLCRFRRERAPMPRFARRARKSDARHARPAARSVHDPIACADHGGRILASPAKSRPLFPRRRPKSATSRPTKYRGTKSHSHDDRRPDWLGSPRCGNPSHCVEQITFESTAFVAH